MKISQVCCFDCQYSTEGNFSEIEKSNFKNRSDKKKN